MARRRGGPRPDGHARRARARSAATTTWASTFIGRPGSLRRPTAGRCSFRTRRGRSWRATSLTAWTCSPSASTSSATSTRPEPLYQVIADGLQAEFPPLKTQVGPSRGNLPPRLTSFIGRDPELDELATLLDSNRLLTLVGPGGAGKTSLATELLRRESGRYRDGTWFVPLESVHDAELVPGVLAATFGLVSGRGSETVEGRLSRFLASRSLALVIDNVEQVLDAAPLLPRLLRAAPELTIVTTSRTPLRVAGEQEFPVPPLAVPPPGQPIDDARAIDAIRLFEDRAARVRPGYRLAAEDVEAVAEICRRLDGLPLGIEIAASRMALLPARDIADRLGRRLDLPGAGSRDAPERQRTLQAAIAWSYDLLRDPERRLLERLSVFAGSFGVPEAEAVAGPPDELGVDVLDGISTLVDHSLVQPAPSSARGAVPVVVHGAHVRCGPPRASAAMPRTSAGAMP